MAAIVELPLETYKGPVDPDWCPGCGDFGVLRSLQQAAKRAGRNEIHSVRAGVGKRPE